MKDHRSLEQMYMDMATLNNEALTPAVKRAAEAIAKEFSKERNAAKKMKMADEVMQNILGEMLEYGTGKARDTYAKETPGQTAGEPEHQPEHARKVNVVLDGVPEKGGMIKKPTITTEAKKLDPVGKADDDIDNDGDVDSSDKYLHNRRKAIKKAIKKEEVEVDEDYRDPKTGGYHYPEADKLHKKMKIKPKYTPAQIDKMDKQKLKAARNEEVEVLSSEEFADFVEDVMLDEVMSQAERIAAIRAAHAKIIKKEKQAERDAKRHMKSPGAQKGMAPVKKDIDESVEEGVMDAVKSKLGKLKKSVSDFHKTDVAAQIRKNKTTKTMEEVEQVDEYITGKQIRMAKGIAFDPRHKGGDYTGAAKKMEKIKKGLSNHPAVKKALRTANESAQPTGVKTYHTSKDGKKGWSINFTADSARKHEASLKKDGHTVTHRSLMYGDKEGPKKKAL